MEVKPIKTKADYRAALREIEALMAAERDTPEVSSLTGIGQPDSRLVSDGAAFIPHPS